MSDEEKVPHRSSLIAFCHSAYRSSNSQAMTIVVQTASSTVAPLTKCQTLRFGGSHGVNNANMTASLLPICSAREVCQRPAPGPVNPMRSHASFVSI